MTGRIRDVPLCVRMIATMVAVMAIFLVGLLVWTSWQQERIAVEEARVAAQQTAEIAVTGLAVAMATGESETQRAFLQQVRRDRGADAVRVVPSDAVVRQYGTKTGTTTGDAIDRQVLASGAPHLGVESRNGNLVYRAVVPVKAGHTVGGKDCLTCHEGQANTVLGVVSLTIDLEHVHAATRTFQQSVTLASLGLGAVLLFLAFLLMRSTVSRPLQAVSEQFHDVADGEGDLTRRVDARGRDEVGRLGASFNQFVERLHGILEQVRDTATGIAAASSQLSEAADDLSGSVQGQAASLEETASSLDQLTGTVKSNAAAALQASELASGSRSTAEHGGQVVRQAVVSMREITLASKQISRIVTAIDEIAFQTNLLALNAAVEAARAGDHGRGFAVVASEVRNLAQRSAAAAREIKTLIDDTTRKVDTGADMVTRSGQSLEEIVASVARVTDLVADIARASQDQAQGLEQVNRAMGDMDRLVQGNASRSSELSATVDTLRGQADDLQALVARFKLRGTRPGPVNLAAEAGPSFTPTEGRPRAVPGSPGHRRPSANAIIPTSAS